MKEVGRVRRNVDIWKCRVNNISSLCSVFYSRHILTVRNSKKIGERLLPWLNTFCGSSCLILLLSEIDDEGFTYRKSKKFMVVPEPMPTPVRKSVFTSITPTALRDIEQAVARGPPGMPIDHIISVVGTLSNVSCVANVCREIFHRRF